MRVGVLEVLAPCLKRSGHNPYGGGDVLQSLTTVLLLGSCSLELPALPLSDRVRFVTHSGRVHETLMVAQPGRVSGAAAAEAKSSQFSCSGHLALFLVFLLLFSLFGY